jgi:phosphopantothenoylcysteine decarboxylase/phosphopantothenate--cysteine ligase
MVEPETIVAHVTRLLRTGAPFAGRHVVVTAGPTREELDPVRVVTNRSSGRMGYALARAAWERGADVTLVTGPTTLAAPTGADVVRVETTAELQAAVEIALPSADVLLMAAAPADFRPARSAAAKTPRHEGAVQIGFEPTPDILLATRDVRKPGAIVVGFALETGEAVSKARAKLRRKHLDLVVANDAAEPGAGPEVETNRVTLVAPDGETALPLLPKDEVAEAILDRVADLLARRG